MDEIATGLIARRRGREALPPRDTQVQGLGAVLLVELTVGWLEHRVAAVHCCGFLRAAASNLPSQLAQVLDDNVYEQRAAAAAAAAGGEDQPAGMEVEQPADAAPAAAVPAAAPTLRRSSLSGRTSSSGSEEAAKEKKKVRFEGIAAPYVPPSRRPGYVPRWVWAAVMMKQCGAPQLTDGRQDGTACLSAVPCHVSAAPAHRRMPDPLQEHRAAAWAGDPAAAAEPQLSSRPRQAPRQVHLLR